ncbi:MAG: helix-turn-helix transcriptional regulator [Anaerolineales bacterium]|nr:helix-turn-helix transcriptional regulator [Anaerolineales bacterium]
MKTSTGSLSPEFTLLGFLSQGPAHGYELHQKLTTELGQVWHLSQSQIYSILNRLERKGYIQGTLQEQDKLPAKRLFVLTKSGKRRFKEWLSAPSRSSARAIRVEFITRLYFAYDQEPRKALQLVEAQIVDTRARLQELETLQSSQPTDLIFNRMGLDLRIRQLNSILGWLTSCQETLASSPKGSSTA